jgi:hypothetical protein
MDRGQGFDRAGAIAWYQKNRERSRQLFDLVAADACTTRIALRHPQKFYQGHLPAFSFNTLVKKGLGGQHRRGSRRSSLETSIPTNNRPLMPAGATPDAQPS